MIERNQESISLWVTEYILSEFGIRLESLDVDLASLGIDSVSAVELVAALENALKTDLEATLLWECKTVEEFVIEAAKIETGVTLEEVERPICDSDFGNYINPYWGRKLEQVHMDKAYVQGNGCRLVDDEGEEYLDLMAQYGTLPFGYNPEHVWQSLLEVHRNSEPSFTQPSIIPVAAALARRLTELAPGDMQYVTYTNSGAESVEAAIKLARSFTGRKGILSTEKSFHGKTMAALSASGSPHYQTPFKLPQPEFSRVPYGDLDALEKILSINPDAFAAFIVEPIQGEAGVNVPPAGYLRKAKQICQKYAVLFIADEIQTGLGRTGKLFACDGEVEPDVITLAKALGGGLMPVGAVLINKRCYTEMYAVKHSSTFAGNILAVKAGMATLDLLTKEDGALVKDVAEKGLYFKQGLQKLQRKYPELISEVRGEGLLLGLKFSINSDLWPENFLGIAGDTNDIAQLIASYLLNVERIRVAPTLNDENVLRIQPALTISKKDIDASLSAFSRTLEILSYGNTGAFYKSILLNSECMPKARLKIHSVSRESYQNASIPRFAFFMHPLDAASFVDFDPTLRELTERELEEFVGTVDGLVEPAVSSTVLIESNTGEQAIGDFILIGRTAESMKNSPKLEVLEDLEKAVEIARQRGADMIGLGAYTSVVTQGGLKLAEMDIPVTTGNSFTTYAGVKAVEMAVEQSGRALSGQVGCVIGAAGAIGSATAILMAPAVKRIVLVGNSAHDIEVTRKKLIKVASAICAHILTRLEGGESYEPGTIGGVIEALAIEERPSADASPAEIKVFAEFLEEKYGLFLLTNNTNMVKMADVIFSATSMPKAFITANILKKGAVLCDLSRPRSIENDSVIGRDDVLVIDGGIIAVPSAPYIGRYGLDVGLAYACMAETMMLTLQRDFRCFSLGSRLPIEDIMYQKALAERHGFEVSSLQMFGKAIDATRWQRYKNAVTLEEEVCVTA